LTDLLGPWQVSGPALAIGAEALADPQWADETRARLANDAARLDGLVTQKGAALIGGTSLFRLYQTPNATQLQTHLATHHIWTRTFPYDPTWIRIGLPATNRWDQLEVAL
jgi:cobalamin biosynthetic protein CobC